MRRTILDSRRNGDIIFELVQIDERFQVVVRLDAAATNTGGAELSPIPGQMHETREAAQAEFEKAVAFLGSTLMRGWHGEGTDQ
jgi:hypothetical protein